ncbi:MAG: FHA domain-containing protein [Desulfobacterales bacterium]|nr:FHA domain-containing protein [Desulfobacterales bacterium]
MLRILLKFNEAVLREIESGKEQITIGRSAENDVQIDNIAVSGEHARIMKGPDHYFIEDLNSTNGTFVNEERITKRVLEENDAITIGKHTLVVAFKKHGDKSQGGKISEIERTWRLETERHKEMLKKQRKKSDRGRGSSASYH